MDAIKIEPTNKTPRVILDANQGVLEIGGRSIPENSTEFYKPIYNWLDEYIKTSNAPTSFKFKLEYFNTSSSKCILDIFRKLEQLHTKGSNVSVEWYYEEDDEDMQEAGEDYQRIVNVPIKLVKMEE